MCKFCGEIVPKNEKRNVIIEEYKDKNIQISFFIHRANHDDKRTFIKQDTYILPESRYYPVLTEIKFCPFCGTELANTLEE